MSGHSEFPPRGWSQLPAPLLLMDWDGEGPPPWQPSAVNIHEAAEDPGFEIFIRQEADGASRKGKNCREGTSSHPCPPRSWQGHV